MKTLLALAAALAIAVPGPLLAQAQKKAPSRGPDVIFVPTPQEVVEDMLRLANVRKGDVLYDLGSGDGRIAITAAKKYGIKATGIDIDPQRIEEATENAKKAGVSDRVQFRQEDLFQANFRDATVVTLYLLPDLNVKLRPKLWNELKPGTRIVSHDYPLTGWIPEKYVQMDLEDKVAISGVTTTLIYMYVVPAKVAGSWRAKMPPALSSQPATLELRQQLTRITGSVKLNGREVPLQDAKLRGDRLSFKLAGRKGEFSGQVKGRSIEGTVKTGGAEAPWSASLGG